MCNVRTAESGDVHRVGFLVNPIAGMGGAVGLKGTDGKRTLQEALRKGAGAKPVSLDRGLRFLAEVQRTGKGIEFLIAPGRMGENIADQLKLQHETIGRIGRTTTSEDSVRVARLMKKKRADLIVFCGGGGRAGAVGGRGGVVKDPLEAPFRLGVVSGTVTVRPPGPRGAVYSLFHGAGASGVVGGGD